MSEILSQNEPAILQQPDIFAQKTMWFFGGSLLLFVFCFAIRPIYDPDFWWHLKSGETMVKTGGLLQFDPFTFSGDGVVSAREAIILKGYWLWQLTAYSLYSLFGFNGISLLNFLTFGAMAGVIITQMRRQQVGVALAAFLVTIGLFFVSYSYRLERPQVISILFAAILVALLSRVRDNEKLGWSLPLVMMVWANLHGGFVVGDLILVCFAAGAVLEYRHNLPRLRHILLWIGVAMGASLLNPNGALVFTELLNFQNSTLMSGVSEYQNTWLKFQKGDSFVAVLWLLIALYGVGIWSSRRLYWPELLVALFLTVFSVAYARNVGFFGLAMLPAIGFHLQQGMSRRQWQLPTFLSICTLLLCVLFTLYLSSLLWQERQQFGPVKSSYPEKAITFLQDSGLQGRMFNSYEYGGYFLWRLAPQMQVFIDGRGMEVKVFDDYMKLSAGSVALVDGRREYEALLDSYAIDTIVQPIYDGDGRVQPLMKSLLLKPEWIPVYVDTYVYILARLTPQNAEVINRYRLDKNEFNTRLLLIYNYACQSAPRQIGYQVARAGMLLYLGMYDEAKAQIETIGAVAPRDRTLPELQRELAILRAKRRMQ